jgi:hypothetical protein
MYGMFLDGNSADDEVHGDVENSDDSDEIPATDKSFTPGSWHAVAYSGKKKTSVTTNYIGQIIEVLPRPKLLNMKFVRKQTGSEKLFKFPVQDDIDPAVPFSYIIQHLDQPTMNNREQFTFKNIPKNIN